MAKKHSGYRVLSRDTRKLPHTLSAEEREKLRDREAELGEKVLALEREHESIRASEKEEARSRRDVIKDARAAWSEAIDARRTGVSQVDRKVETRAVIATRTIDVVIVSSGDVLESRPMSQEEQRDLLQGDLEVPDAAEQATPSDPPESVEDVDEDDDSAVDVPQADALDAGEAQALGLPEGWLRSWRGAEWTVNVNGDEKALREADVLDVYLRLQPEGTTVPVLLGGRDGVGPLDWLKRQRVVRALSLLVGARLATKVGRGKWAPASAPQPDPEPGKSDPLPEAGDVTRPRLAEPQTKADALLADAGETAAAWGM